MTTPAVCCDKAPHCRDGVCVGEEGGPSIPPSSRRSHDTDHTADHLLGGEKHTVSSESCDIQSKGTTTANSNSTTSCGMFQLPLLLLVPYWLANID